MNCWQSPRRNETNNCNGSQINRCRPQNPSLSFSSNPVISSLRSLSFPPGGNRRWHRGDQKKSCGLQIVRNKAKSKWDDGGDLSYTALISGSQLRQSSSKYGGRARGWSGPILGEKLRSRRPPHRFCLQPKAGGRCKSTVFLDRIKMTHIFP